jgi:hypothetical protein
MVPIEDKKHMHNAESQQTPQLSHFPHTMVPIDNCPSLHFPCYQEDPFLVDRRILTYHKLKKKIRERKHIYHISTIGHHSNKSPNISFHILKQSLRSAENEKEKTLIGNSHLWKKDAKKIYMEQIKDTPWITCAICEELHFQKNIKCFTYNLEKEYVSLTLNDRTFSTKTICVLCKRSLQNGKVPQFATPDQIKCNTPLPDVSTLS